MKKLLIKRLLFIPLGAIAYGATLFAQHNTDWTEQVYSQSVYPALSTLVGFLPSLVRFSVAEWLVVLFLVFCVGYVVYYVRKIIVGPNKRIVAKEFIAPDNSTNPAKKDSRGMALYRGITGIVAIVCIVYFAFTALCGLNYYRHSFIYYTGYSVEQSSIEELDRLCVSLADEVGEAREQLGKDSLPASELEDFNYYSQQSVRAVQTLARQYPILDRPLYSAPKPVIMSELMSDAGIGGMYFPFTAESNINADVPLFTLPSTMTHELAHQCGFMREDEANFIAYLACKQSDDPLTLYSGLYLAFSKSISALEKVDPERAADIMNSLPPSVKNDMAENRQFWTQHEGPLSDISHATNDAYLKANNQTDGVRSYGRMVDLLLAERRE